VMEGTKLRLNLFRLRNGAQPEAFETYYVLSRRPAGGMVARVTIEEALDLRKHDTLIFDFATDSFVGW